MAETAGDDVLAGFPSIVLSEKLSQDRIDSARTKLAAEPDGLDIVGFGSLARREVTVESDFDYLVLSCGLPERPSAIRELLDEAHNLRREWAQAEGRNDDVPMPGTSGLFGVAVGAFGLVDQIGLQGDTNHSLTRRMLLLGESVSLRDQHVHDEVLTAALRRYLEHADDAETVPRFLLNDLLRYWHTIAVDYQAKARSDISVSGLRYLKLLISRKILFAGTAMSLLLCGKDGFHRADVEDLLDQFSMSPIRRLVQGMNAATDEVRDAMGVALDVLDQYLEASGDAGWRDEMSTSHKGNGSERFSSMLDNAHRLQEALETIFFDWDVVSADTRKLMVF